MHTKRSTSTRLLGLAAATTAALAAGVMAGGPAGATSSNSASVSDDTLTVIGSSRGEALALRVAADGSTTLEVDFGDDGSADESFDLTTFSSIEVFLRSGNDRFRVDEVNGTISSEDLTVYGGSGNDTLDGGAGGELFKAGSGRDTVDGNRGDDTAELGSGSDTFRWDPGDGSDVVEGRSGTDTLDFNGANAAEIMSLSPNGGRSLFLRDVGNIRMDMDGVERLDLIALGGPDTVTVEDMTGTDFRQADVDLSALGDDGSGDAQTDTVAVDGTERRDNVDVEADGSTVEVDGLKTTVDITGSETSDVLQVNTLGGDDDVDVEEAARDLIGVVVDLGSGQR